MESIARATAAFICLIAPFAARAADGITVAPVTVGRNLQAWTAVRLPQPVPQAPVQLTLTSDDPTRLLLSKRPDQPGSASIALTVPAHRLVSPDFCLQGLANAGTVTYTISAEGAGSAKGTVKLAPSAIVILGPHKAPKLTTTPHALPSRITVVSAVLDSSLKVADEQPVAGGSQVEVTLANSNSKVGALGASKLTIPGGSSSVDTYFQPSAEGDTTIAPVPPPSFSKPAERASLSVVMRRPGMAISSNFYLGKDLQTSAALCLGEPAPAGGLKVVLTSADPSKILISAAETQPGSASITLAIPASQSVATYYIQALASSGTVTYDAVAPGFWARTATVWLAPSGVILAYERYGPPEEGNVRHNLGVVGPREFSILRSDAKKHPVRIIAWTAYLEPETGRAADITIQPLRAGMKVSVALANSNPGVGTVQSPLVITAGNNRAFGDFTPLAKGTTVISVDTPPGFSTPKNATSVPADVLD